MSHKRLNTFLIVFVLCFPTMGKSDDVEIYFGRYQDDARLTVLTPGIRGNIQATDEVIMGAKYVFERFDKSAPDNAFDAVSTATTVAGGTGGGFQQDRHEASLSGSYQAHDSTTAVGIIGSEEEDFRSRAVSVAYSHDVLQKNLTFTGQYSFTYDSILKGDSQTVTFPQNKSVNSGTLALTQILDPKTWLIGGYTYANVFGFQSQPSRKISVITTTQFGTNSEIKDEQHPNSRQRHVLFLRSKRYFETRSAFEINLSRYFDDWGVSADTVETAWFQYLNTKTIVRVRYRFYQQSAADFYQSTYTAEQPLMTADARLRRYNTHMIGVKLMLTPSGFSRAWRLSTAYDYYRETNAGLRAHIVKLAVQYVFEQ